MKAVIVLVLLAVLFFAVEAKRKCVESANVECKYERKCVALRNVCKRSETVRHRCAAFGKKWADGFKKQKVCVKWNRSFRAKGRRCQRCVKTAIRHKKIRVQKTFCKRYHTKKVCRQWSRVCKRHRAVKRCWVVEHLFNLRGPKRCRAGFHLSFKKTGRTIRRRCVRGNRSGSTAVCNSYLDPHTTAAGRNFEFQYSGDRVMAETADGVFAVHQRLKNFGSFTGTIGMAVRANGRDVVEYLGKSRLLLNGKPINTKGVTELPEGGSVKMSQHGAQTHVEVFGSNGARAYLVEFSGTYANLIVYTPTSVPLSGGYCTGANISKWASLTASGLFQFRRKVRFLSSAQKKANAKRNKPSRRQRRNASIRCRAAGLKGVTLRNCIKDVLAVRGTGQTGRIIRIFKDVKREVRAGKRAVRPAVGGRRRRGWLRRAIRRL